MTWMTAVAIAASVVGGIVVTVLTSLFIGARLGRRAIGDLGAVTADILARTVNDIFDKPRIAVSLGNPNAEKTEQTMSLAEILGNGYSGMLRLEEEMAKSAKAVEELAKKAGSVSSSITRPA